MYKLFPSTSNPRTSPLSLLPLPEHAHPLTLQPPLPPPVPPPCPKHARTSYMHSRDRHTRTKYLQCILLCWFNTLFPPPHPPPPTPPNPTPHQHSVSLSNCLSVCLSLPLSATHAHTHTHMRLNTVTHMHIACAHKHTNPHSPVILTKYALSEVGCFNQFVHLGSSRNWIRVSFAWIRQCCSCRC